MVRKSYFKIQSKTSDSIFRSLLPIFFLKKNNWASNGNKKEKKRLVVGLAGLLVTGIFVFFQAH
jgi:hypothetical protein